MKIRQKVLAFLVLSSVLHVGICSAADYGNQENVTGTDIVFDKMEIGKSSPEKITIGNESTQNITVGSDKAGERDAVLQLNDPILAGSQGSHDLTLYADDIKIIGGKGIVMGGQAERDKVTLTVLGKNFIVQNNSKYGGLNASGYGSLYIGSQDKWLENVTIEGGGGLSVGFTGSGSVDDRAAEIYAKNVVLDTTKANETNGTAFSNGDSKAVITADTITIKSTNDSSSSTSGTIYVYDSTTDFNANIINIEAKDANQWLYAIQAKSEYDLNLHAEKDMKITGNIFLEDEGTANLTGGNIVITGTHTYDEANDSNNNDSMGAAVFIDGNAKLYLGTEDKQAQNVSISSQGKYGILVGDVMASKSNANLTANVKEHFIVKAEKGTGIAVEAKQDHAFADIKTGTMQITAAQNGLSTNQCGMNIAAQNGISIEAGEIAVNAQGAGNNIDPELNLTTAENDITIQGTKTALFVKDYYTVDLNAENGSINIITTDKSASSGNERAAVYTTARMDGLAANINLSAENGSVNIEAVDKAVWATADAGAINIDGAVNITTQDNKDENDFALQAESAINVNLKGTENSFIGNDIIAKNNGRITINSEDYDGQLVVKGDILAGKALLGGGSAGEVSVDFGKKGNFTGKTGKYSGVLVNNGTIDLSFDKDSVWNMTDSSILNTLTANNAKIDMTSDANKFSTLTVKEFTGNSTTINMDIDAATNVDNSDRIYVNGTHTGEHYITLNNIGSGIDDAEGTVLVSVKDEQGSFKANDSEGSLYWNKYELGVKDSADQKYTKDWYLEKVEIIDPDDKPTTSVDTILSVNSLNYHTWRTENDKLLQRMGELRHNGEEEKGAWFRMHGSKIGRDGQFGFENKYTTYELGFDNVTKRTGDMVRYQGVALSYTDGSSGYGSGSGENHNKAIGFYSTDQYSKGHYLDLALKISNLDNDFAVVDTNGKKITGEFDNTGSALSAEYGRKNDLRGGWYIEPQAQLTLGYLGGAEYESSNGITVEQSGITSAVGRVGFNIGKQIGERGIIYAKANLLHEFGGGYDVEMRHGADKLAVSDTFNDTWFEYGVGAAFATSKNSHVYFDVERSTGSDFYKDWEWNAGVRWSF